jgi:hypothetical protein
MDFAKVSRRQTAEDAREGGFSGAIAANEGMDLPALQFKAKIRQHRNAVAFLQSRYDQKWGGVGHPG